ncbi:nuclear transport factor 2 family protein [Nakamurella sp. YIM 132087]|uniref:Nuclear transport factor 2 family protein n=1 Tax=Nakamurella alba TaxID=2665158 RepID=A0A7K1FTT1_9ACTN|nr:nuclear transport factor 2 family protein [Nakamurella alba]MTD17490.1 nuclear transport factor 2 family protein [Nakamurella alba]
MSVAHLRAMFDRMVIEKDATAVAKFYHPDFQMVSNGMTQDYGAFLASHQGVYDTAISYSVRYDEDAWVETGDRVAGRMWITTARPKERPTEIEVILIATYREGLIHRLWELTWPDWSRLAAFENYES